MNKARRSNQAAITVEQGSFTSIVRNVKYHFCLTVTSLFFRLLAAVTCIFICLSSISQGQNQLDLAALREVYLQAAFAKDDSELLKFRDARLLTYNLVCETYNSDKCMNALELLKSSISENSAMRLQQVEEGGQIEIRLAGAHQLEKQSALLSLEFKGGQIEAENRKCQLFLTKIDNTVLRAVVVVSLDTPRLEFNSCILIGFVRSMGLSLSWVQPFSEHNVQAQKLAEMLTQSDFDRIKLGSNVLAYVHACEQLHAGMSRAQVAEKLNPQSKCLQNIELQ